MSHKKILFILFALLLFIIFFFSNNSNTPLVLSNHFNNENIPEPRSQIIEEQGFSKKNKINISQNFMVVTANSYATDVAHKVLSSGGTAIDAAIAAQMVLGLVEPQSSGLGGGGFMLYWDASSKNIFRMLVENIARQSPNR